MNRIAPAVMMAAVFVLAAGQGRASNPGPSVPAETTERKAERTEDEALRVTLSVPLAEPRFSGVPVAIVNDETITLEHLTEIIASTHAERKDTQNQEKIKMNLSEPLRRLIDIQLIVQEARTIGLDELPEVKRELDIFFRTTLRQNLIQDIVKDVTVDDKEVEPIYAAMVREWKVQSVFFKDEGKAKDAARTIKQGADFNALAVTAINEGLARGSMHAQYLRAASLSPEIVKVVSKMKIGGVSPIVKVEGGPQPGYTLVKLEDVRYPQNPEEREIAPKQALAAKKKQKLQAFQLSLAKKYMTVNRNLLDSLDYEAKQPGMQKLLGDKRVLATIAGEDPILVKDLSKAIQEPFFHGMEKAIKEKRINKMKRDMLYSIAFKKLMHKEALLRELDRTRLFREQFRKKEESVLFGVFIQKVIAPRSTFGDDDLKAYYRDHVSEYTYPAMVKLDGIAFNTVRDAEVALDKLKRDADLAWIKKNAEGLADANDEDLLSFGENPVLLSSLPAALQQVLSGSHPGDYRLATTSENRSYVLLVQQEIPARQQPIEEVVQTVAENVLRAKLNAATEEWIGKLRNAADIRVYLSTPARM
ncbi:MAG: peptidylprolyl isomerase [Nitrospirota bacterium]